ncbi:uncharacterized protein LOC125029520 [Penaeus chinensis]|uniref:uncharacterized protein LOC125029520 n=1 Tax=Penaeus chinensis TaxID=139456 RepID=UPI001FB62347|nr:uncharacterized protein LOC125029520 [Penaeus chinensis]
MREVSKHEVEGLKLMCHTLKLLERIIGGTLREEVCIGGQQLGFMKGMGTTDGLVMLRQSMEKCREKQKVLHMAFIDLKKTYDRVPREEVWRSLRERGAQKKYVSIIKESCRNATTKVGSTIRAMDSFLVKVGLHLASASSRFLVNIVCDVLRKHLEKIHYVVSSMRMMLF